MTKNSLEIPEAVARVVEMFRTLGADWWVTPKGAIRARGSNLDPLVELYRRRTQRPLSLARFTEAGAEFGLTESESLRLAIAADVDDGSALRVLLLATLIK